MTDEARYGRDSNPDSLSTLPGSSARLGWVMYDWAAQPFYTLIMTFLFAPYFVNYFVGNAIRGQALWGYSAAIAGLMVAVLSPFLGAIADVSGKRKPWVVAFTLILVLCMAGLWLAEPGIQGRVPLIIFLVISAILVAEFATVFVNAMMPTLTTPDKLGRLSGTGWAVGYLGGMVSLVMLAGFIVVMPDSDKTLLGISPILPLDPLRHESERFVGLFSAGWLIIFSIPFFLFTPDRVYERPTIANPIKDGFHRLKITITSLGNYRNIVLFLLARMLYIDGLSAIFTFGGIYATSIFGWSSLELAMFGIVLTVSGAIGAWVGGLLDDYVGSKFVIGCGLWLLLLASFGIISVDRNNIFFVLEVVARKAGSFPFSSSGELVYMAFAILIGLVAGPLQSSSRTLLARLAPPEKLTEFFGLYAFSGKVTSFLAPFLVAGTTSLFGSQRIGISTIIIFIIAGLVLLAAVRNPQS